MSDGHWDTLMGNRPAKPAPQSDRLAQRWRLKATSGRVWECATYQVATGIELRVQTEGKDDPV